MATTPWAILLCKFKDQSVEPHSVQHFQQYFTQAGSGMSNMTDFYAEASHGALDQSGNRVIGWYQLNQNLADYQGSGANPAGRNDLVSWARSASPVDLKGFGAVLVVTNVGVDLFGSPGQAVCGPDSTLSEVAQEMGHGFGLQHSRKDGSDTDYQDSWDVMSTDNAYETTDANWGSIGPQLNAANMASQNWLDAARTWQGGGTVDLRPLHRRDLPGYLAARAGDLFVEYRSKESWDAGIFAPTVLVHRFSDEHSYLMGDVDDKLGMQKGGHVEYGDITLRNGGWSTVDVLGIDDNARTATIGLTSFAQGQRDHYAAVWVQEQGPAWQAFHDLTADQYQQKFTELGAQGYRVTWLSGYTVGGTARFAAVWVQQSGPAWVGRHNLTADQYQQAFNDLGAQGYRLICVSGYTVNGQTYFAAVWVQESGPAWVGRHNLTAAQYQQAFNDLGAQGYRLTCVNGYDVNGQPNFAGVWVQQSGPAWVGRHNLTAAQYQQAFNDLGAQGYRLICVSGYTANGQPNFAAVWVQQSGPAWVGRHNLTAAQYQQAFNQLGAQGYRLISVSGYDANP